MNRRDRIVALDKRRVWHPYTPMRQYIAEAQPLVIERAEGAYLYDTDGRRYLDGNASWWVALLGHRHPRLLAALRRQSERLCHVALAGITHEPAARLADELCTVAPAGLERVFFTDDGSTAVELALKLALQHWHNAGVAGRHRLLALGGAFHGDTLGAAALGGVEVFRSPFDEVLLDCEHLPVPPADPQAPDYAAAVAALESALDRQPQRVAALVLEPLVQGAAGMRMYCPEYLQAARRLCDAHDVLLVLDEVFTGFGRTGTMWACEQAGVVPDVLCTAKGLSGGILPLGAALVTERLFESFCGEPERALYYGHTYCGHPLGAAVAREVLAIYRDEHIVEQVGPKARRIAEAFARFGQLEGVRAHRALGMIGAVELAGGGGYLGQGGWRVYREALSRGAYLRPLGDVVYITPPLNIADEQLDALLDIVEASLRAAARG